jgi:hypothetical protein
MKPIAKLLLVKTQAKSERGNVFPCSKLRLWMFYMHNVGELRGYMLGYDLDANESTLSGPRCSIVDDLFNLIPPTHGRAIGVGEGYVFAMGEHLLHRLGVAFEELI